jgi:hypothetical protein
MRTKSLCLAALITSSLPALAQNLALEDAAKQFLRDSAQPSTQQDTGESADSASGSVEKAKNLKESMDRMPALQNPAGAAPPEAAKPPPAQAAPGQSVEPAKPEPAPGKQAGTPTPPTKKPPKAGHVKTKPAAD